MWEGERERERDLCFLMRESVNGFSYFSSSIVKHLLVADFSLGNEESLGLELSVCFDIL